MWGTQVPNFYFGLIPGIIRSTGEAFVKKLATDTARGIKSKIIQQQFHHKPLTPNYLLWKKRKGYDTRILIRTRFFLDNIGAFNESVREAIVYRVGVKDLAYPDGKRLQTIARYLEYGTSKMVARPVFRPTSRELSAKIHTHVLRLSNLLTNNLKKKLPHVDVEQMVSRAFTTGNTEIMQQRRVIIRGMVHKRHVRTVR
jgi:hypothetical protein